MELKDFAILPCKSRLAFEFIPKKNESLQLERIAEQLKKNGIEVEISTPFLLMLRVKGIGVSVFKSGKIIVKDCNIETDARGIAQELIQKMQ